MKCRQCSFENLDGSKFCERCGRPLESVCPNCQAPVSLDALFCRNCGTDLQTSASPDRLSALRQSAPQALQEKFHAASAHIEGERKPVTILFTDIVGSTALAEKLDPEEWKEIVNGAHQRVSEAVYRYEGTIAQLLGDGVLAFFGAPITHEDDPIRAVRAGLDIQRSIEEYAQQLTGYVDHFQLRVGINSGTVVVGSVGSDLHMEYLAIGDAVNLAARLQSAAQPGRVLISEATERLVKAVFDLNGLGEINVKGKIDPVKVFEVVEPKAVPLSGRGLEGLTSALVGRDQELAILQADLAKLIAGHGQIIAVLGEAGIGKSRLVEEARQHNLRAPGAIRWLESRALSYGQTLSFWPIIQLLQNDLGLSDGDPETKIKIALRRRLTDLFGDRSAEIMPFLARLMGLKLQGEPAERVHRLDGETLKRQTIRSLVEYFSRAGQHTPSVLVFEDFHWADPSTLAAMEQLLAVTERAPIIILLLMRVERDHGSWQIKLQAETNYEHRYTELYLKALSDRDSNQLVNQLLAVADLPDSTRQLILERSEGNPFYLEEIVRSLIEQGALVQADQRWRATDRIRQVTIPDTLQGVLLARIDRLQEDVRRTLQLASVIGKSFLYRLLEAIAEAERELDEHLSQLQRADLVREKTRRPELEYIFKHSLTQEAAYNSLLIERRREFHHKVGAALEQLFPDRRDEFLGLLAHHFDAAGDRAKAIDYLIQAGDKSRLADAHPEAIQAYRRAIELLNETGDLDRASKTWLKLGLIHQANFDFEKTHRAYEAAFAFESQTSVSHTRSRLTEFQPKTLHRLKLAKVQPQFGTFAPDKAGFEIEAWVIQHLFAGLAEFDSETNVVPHVARSWEVLDGGRRYMFHLRDNVRWTDGTPVTALDFEWAWKHNLAPNVESSYKSLLDDIVGARDYREGRNPDPDSIGVRALDPLTLEVRLTTPVTYFIYLVTQPITYPLPRSAVEQHGDDWWRPEHIVSNGAFRLLEFDLTHGLMARNPDYFGNFPGNLDQFEWKVLVNIAEVLNAYNLEEVDHAWSLNWRDIPTELSAGEWIDPLGLITSAITLAPNKPPLDDVRIRRAIAHAIDRERLFESISGKRQPWANGGIVPPGMAGHSPELGLKFDLEQARQLLAEAGYPNGRNLPVIKYHYILGVVNRYEFERQLCEHLGIRVEPIPKDTKVIRRENVSDSMIGITAWSADYPDPNNFLRESTFYRWPHSQGWHHPHLEQLLEVATRTVDRAQRLAMYREADRILVNEEAVVIPFAYDAGNKIKLWKPWVTSHPYNALGAVSLKEIVIEPH